LSAGIAGKFGATGAEASPDDAGERRQASRQGQTLLDVVGRFADLDKTDVGAFWNCVTGTEVDVGMFESVDQIQQRVESAYFTKQKRYPEILTKECVPRLAAARLKSAALRREMAGVLKPPFEKYLAALPRMQQGIVSYAAKLAKRGAVKDVDVRIQEVGAAFTTEPTPESIAFVKFMACAIPDLDQKPDIETVLEFMANTCKTDSVSFMTRVRAACGALVQNVNKNAKPSRTFAANAEKFYEEDQRQLLAWEWCGKQARKRKNLLDLETFLTAAGDYLEARGEVVGAAREAARVSGAPPSQATK
jgi:hypothetical protein